MYYFPRNPVYNTNYHEKCPLDSLNSSHCHICLPTPHLIFHTPTWPHTLHTPMCTLFPPVQQPDLGKILHSRYQDWLIHDSHGALRCDIVPQEWDHLHDLDNQWGHQSQSWKCCSWSSSTLASHSTLAGELSLQDNLCDPILLRRCKIQQQLHFHHISTLCPNQVQWSIFQIRLVIN